MAHFKISTDGVATNPAALIAATSRELADLGDEAITSFLERPGRRPVRLTVRGAPTCTGFQQEGSSHTDTMVEERAHSDKFDVDDTRTASTETDS